MEDPVKEISSVVYQFTATNSPNVQKSAIEQYMTTDVTFQHPVCFIKAGPNSREAVLGIYQWYRVLSPDIKIRVDSIVFDSNKNILYLEAVQCFKIFFLPIKPAPARLITRLTLRKKGGLYYIARQEDFYHTEARLSDSSIINLNRADAATGILTQDFAALLLPRIVPFVRIGLTVSGVISNLFAQAASLFGYWRPSGQAE